MFLVSSPDPTLSQGKGSDNWVFSCLCWVNSLVFTQANQIAGIRSYILNIGYTRVAPFAHAMDYVIPYDWCTQLRKCSNITRPLPCMWVWVWEWDWSVLSFGFCLRSWAWNNMTCIEPVENTGSFCTVSWNVVHYTLNETVNNTSSPQQVPNSLLKVTLGLRLSHSTIIPPTFELAVLH